MFPIYYSMRKKKSQVKETKSNFALAALKTPASSYEVAQYVPEWIITLFQLYLAGTSYSLNYFK